jgi:hypothetical protein
MPRIVTAAVSNRLNPSIDPHSLLCPAMILLDHVVQILAGSQTAALLGVSLAQLVKAGTLVYAKREFLNHKKYSTAAERLSGGSIAFRLWRRRRYRRSYPSRLPNLGVR